MANMMTACKPCQMLNDNTINEYCRLIDKCLPRATCTQIFQSYLFHAATAHPSNAHGKITKVDMSRVERHKDLRQCTLAVDGTAFFPVHHKKMKHWTLVVHCASEKRIFSFDSCPGEDGTLARQARQVMCTIIRHHKSAEDTNWAEWRQGAVHVPHQSTGGDNVEQGNDCGCVRQ
jgi:Ulp1 family protease